MYYELVSLLDYSYTFDPDWVNDLQRSAKACECGNILPSFRDESIDVYFHRSESLESLIPTVSYKLSVNILHSDLVQILNLQKLDIPIGKVYVGDKHIQEYHSLVFSDLYRHKKHESEGFEFRKCKCGRQLGGSLDWQFKAFELDAPEIISTDYGYGVFVLESVLDSMGASMLDELVLHPRKVARPPMRGAFEKA